MPDAREPVDAFLVCLPESAGSALYGMVDVLCATGTLWRELSGEKPGGAVIRPRLVSTSRAPFRCGNAIPVEPDAAIAEVADPGIVIVPELWLAPDDDLSDRYDELKAWLRAAHAGGAIVYSACTGAILLAASGLLDGREATSHWAIRTFSAAPFRRCGSTRRRRCASPIRRGGS